MSLNLTKSNYDIYLQDPDRILEGIYWESCSGIGMTSTPINTSNGRNKYMIPTKPQPKPIQLSRAANVDDDFRIQQWIDRFCADKPIIEGVNQGTILMIVPTKPCAANEPYGKTIKVFNCVYTDFNMFDADIMNTTDVSRTTLSLTWTHHLFS